MTLAERIFLLMAGVSGALGVVFAAMSAHGNYADTLKTCSEILLVHAPALLAIAALLGGKTPKHILFLGGFLIFIGLCLFCGDLARRTFMELRLFPMAAPIGGASMIIGWILIALAAFAPRMR